MVFEDFNDYCGLDFAQLATLEIADICHRKAKHDHTLCNDNMAKDCSLTSLLPLWLLTKVVAHAHVYVHAHGQGWKSSTTTVMRQWSIKSAYFNVYLSGSTPFLNCLSLVENS